jgi:hypothetical protein
MIARQILDAAALELALAAAAVTRRLGLARGPIIVAGGTFLGAPSLWNRLGLALDIHVARAEVRRLSVPPAQGAVRLATALARGIVQVPQYLEDANE